MRCLSCGAEAEPGTKFCRNCGVPLQDQAAPTQRFAAQTAPQPYHYQQTQRMPTPTQTNQSHYAAGMPPTASTSRPTGTMPSFPGGYGQRRQASSAPFVLSIIALVTALLGIFPVSLLLAIIALVKRHSQKKRGEYSGKQTPALVMSVISLILSILMALASVLVGGVFWLALLSGEVDLEHITESTAPTQAVSAEEQPQETPVDPSPVEVEDAPSSEPPSDADTTEPEPEATPTQTTGSYDAVGDPTLGDFTWFAGGTPIPEDAEFLSSIYDVEGAWKAYIFDSEMDRLCTLRITAGQGEATATISWLYAHDNSTDTGFEDNTPDSEFTGSWMGASGLDALGPGRLELTDFWQVDGKQYGMGTYMWPSGETDTVLLVRP